MNGVNLIQNEGADSGLLGLFSQLCLTIFYSAFMQVAYMVLVVSTIITYMNLTICALSNKDHAMMNSSCPQFDIPKTLKPSDTPKP